MLLQNKILVRYSNHCTKWFALILDHPVHVIIVVMQHLQEFLTHCRRWLPEDPSCCRTGWTWKGLPALSSWWPRGSDGKKRSQVQHELDNTVIYMCALSPERSRPRSNRRWRFQNCSKLYPGNANENAQIMRYFTWHPLHAKTHSLGTCSNRNLSSRWHHLRLPGPQNLVAIYELYLEIFYYKNLKWQAGLAPWRRA